MGKLRRAALYAVHAFIIRLRGKYTHSVWDGQCSYSVYEYKSKVYYLSLIEGDEQ